MSHKGRAKPQRLVVHAWRRQLTRNFDAFRFRALRVQRLLDGP